MATKRPNRSATARHAPIKAMLSRIGRAIVTMALLAALADVALADTPVSGMKAVAAGTYHTCAVTAHGGAQCWGVNDYGQRGDGRSVVFQSTPVDVVGLSSGVTAISAGNVHTCAATATGVDCWGRGYYGELGDGAGVSRMTPVHVVGVGPGVKGIATGSAHSCAITASNGVRCWGANDFGQLGDGTFDKRLTPVGVSGLGSGVSAIAAGGVHTCALTATGAVKCWGRTTIGQPIEPTPIDVPGLGSGVVAIAVGGDHACAVTATGNASCWGLNKYGELGDGTLNSTTVPVTVVGMGAGAQAIAAGGDDGGSHTCALTVAGGVKCWGSGLLGQVGDGAFAERHTPVDVIGLASGATAIATGRFHSCAVTIGGGIKCWGSNLSAQIGDNSKTLRLVPTASSLDERVTAIAAGHWHTCAVTASGGARCWGEGAFGQIGDGASITRLVPTDVAGLGSGIAGVTAGEHFGCAKTLAGGAKCWGSNAFGQVGDGTFDLHPAPVDVVGLAPATIAITAGRWHACAILTGGQPKCWGGGGSGQLGIVPPSFHVPLPVSVVGLSSGVAAITAGEQHTCAVVSGAVKCWGDNHYGQIGDGTREQRNTPTDVIGLGARPRPLPRGSSIPAPSRAGAAQGVGASMVPERWAMGQRRIARRRSTWGALAAACSRLRRALRTPVRSRPEAASSAGAPTTMDNSATTRPRIARRRSTSSVSAQARSTSRPGIATHALSRQRATSSAGDKTTSARSVMGKRRHTPIRGTSSMPEARFCRLQYRPSIRPGSSS